MLRMIITMNTSMPHSTEVTDRSQYANDTKVIGH